jgi:hypothetical protein
MEASAATINVPAGGDLQAAINAAQPGDVITLAPGARYQGPFRLPANSGTSYVTIRTSAPDSALPGAGVRIDPSYFANLPKLVAPAGGQVVYTAMGAHHFRFIGVEISPTSGTFLYNVVQLGDGSETATDMLPHDIVFDRVYIHGDATAGARRGIAANGANITVINSYISDCKEAGADSQAIGGWNGTGPLLIQNNYLSAAGENILIGGQYPNIAGLVTRNITVKGNHFYKPTSWRGSAWSVKNLFELKNADQVEVDGNVFENNWGASQNGFAILFTTRGEDGKAPQAVVSNVKFTNNIIRHVAGGVNILGRDNMSPSQQGHDYLISNNLFEDVNGATWGGTGRLFQILNGAKNVTITHNSGFPDGAVLMADLDPSPGLVFQNNMTTSGSYGVIGSGSAIGTTTLSSYFPGFTFNGNVIIAGNQSAYPGGNFFPGSTSAVGFVSYSSDVSLAASSPYHNAGTDGTDIGVKLSALNPGVTSPTANGGSGSTGGGTTGSDGTTSPGTTTPGGTTGGSTSGGTTSGGTTASGPGRVEQNGPGVTLSGSWSQNGLAVHSGGSAVLSMSKGSTASFSFNGTGVTWIAYRDAWSGMANVYVDGNLKASVDTYSAADQAKASMQSIAGLSSGVHTLVIEVAGTKNAASSGMWVWVDAFDVTDGTSTGTSGGTTSGGTTSGGTTSGGTTSGGTTSGGTTSGGTTSSGSAARVEQNGPGVTLSGSWSQNGLAVHSGGSAVLSMSKGSTASFAFNGTSVTWIAFRDAWSGIANVYVDGTLKATVDTYSATDQAKASMQSITGLNSGAHTLVIEVAGAKNAAASGMWVWVDAFDVTSGATASGGTTTAGGTTTQPAPAPSPAPAPAPSPDPTPAAGAYRAEQTSGAVQWSGAWSVNNGAFNSGGSAKLASAAGASATFKFTGTGVSWLAYRDEWSGIARVYIDGQLKSTVDTYSSPGQAKTAAYTLTGLPWGAHTITIEATGTKSGSSKAAWIWVDAFDFIGAALTSAVTSIDPPSSVSIAMSGGTLTSSGGQPLLVGSAQLSPPGGGAAPSGVAVLGYRQNGVLVSEAGVPASVSVLRGRIFAEVAGATNTGVAVANPNNTDATVSFFLTANNGTVSAIRSLTIPAHGQISRFLDEAPFGVTRPYLGTLTFKSDVPVAAAALRGFTNERSEFLVTTVPVANPDTQGPATAFFPHLADGGGWTTQLVLVNPSEAPITGSLRFLEQGSAGSTSNVLNSVPYAIPAGSSYQFSTPGTSASGQVMSAFATPDQGSIAPVGSAIFSFKRGGITVSEAGSPSTLSGNAFRMYVESNEEGIRSGVAIQNGGNSDTRVFVELSGLDGIPLGLKGSVTIPALGQRAMFLDEIPGFENLSVPFQGVLRVSAANSDDIAVLGLRTRTNERGDFLITTMPPTNEMASPNANVSFPHIVNGGGYTTELVTFSGTSAEAGKAAIELFSQDGSPLQLGLK